MKRSKGEPTRRHKRKLERLEERKKKRDNKREARDDKRNDRQRNRQKRLTALNDRRALIATVVAIALSVTVAVPSQMKWFLGQLSDGHWVFPGALVAVVATLLVEGLCWLGAFLYADSIAATPVRLYRVTTFVFAGIAAAINYKHGATTNTVVGVVYALASLMGVGAWELYMHRTRHVASGMTADEIKLWARRWRTHPRVMRETGRIRATFGATLPLEVAWRMAYVRCIGNPTVPVALTDPMISRLFVTETPESAEQDPESSAPSSPQDAAEGVIELPLNWDSMVTAEDVIRAYWTEPETEPNTPEQPPVPPAVPHPKDARSSAPSTPKPATEQGVTSGTAGGTRNSTRTGTRNSNLKRVPPTKAELNGTEDAKTRIGKYLKRAELNGTPIAELDRNYIAAVFAVSDRYVRTAIKTHTEGPK